MNKKILGCTYNPCIDINFIRKENCKMSQCLLLRNKNGAIVLSDSALTSFDENNIAYLNSIEFPKVWTFNKSIATHAGIMTYDNNVKMELENKNRSFVERLNAIVYQYNKLLQQSHDFEFVYQLLVIRYNNGILESYFINANGIQGEAVCQHSLSNTPLLQPIGLYSNQILNEIQVEDIKEKTLDELLNLGTATIQKYIDLDKEKNDGIFVNGHVYAISMDTKGNIKTYIDGLKKERA